MKLLLVLISIILPAQCLAQINPMVYASIPEQQKEITYFDDFDNANNLFSAGACTIDSKIMSADVNNGNFSIYCTRKSPNVAYPFRIPLDYDKNIEISFNARINGGRSTYGLVIFATDTLTPDKCATFAFENNGTGGFYYDNMGMNKEEVTYLTTNAVKDAYNTYVIRKYAGVYYFFVNEKYCGQREAGKNQGSIITLGSSRNATVDYNYLKVSYLR